jgi:hypothetical protein
VVRAEGISDGGDMTTNTTLWLNFGEWLRNVVKVLFYVLGIELQNPSSAI